MKNIRNDIVLLLKIKAVLHKFTRRNVTFIMHVTNSRK